jgi:hypothetical protein
MPTPSPTSPPASSRPIRSGTASRGSIPTSADPSGSSATTSSRRGSSVGSRASRSGSTTTVNRPGAIVVAEGRLHETTLGAHGPELRALDRGNLRRIAPKAVHGIANLDARAATSLHVYSPPLDRMTRFDATNLQPTRTVDVEPMAPVLPNAVAQLLRIARRV